MNSLSLAELPSAMIDWGKRAEGLMKNMLEQVAGNGLLHRRLFLTQGAALLGAGATLLAARPAHAEPLDVRAMDEGAGCGAERVQRSFAIRRARAARDERVAWHHRHGRLANAARAPRRHHHAELAALRAPSQRCARHRSRAASVVDPRARRAAAAVRRRRRCSRYPLVSRTSVSRVLGQQWRSQQFRSRRSYRPG